MSSIFLTSSLNIRQSFKLQEAHRGGQGIQDLFCKDSPLLQPVHIVMLAILQLRQPWVPGRRCTGGQVKGIDGSTLEAGAIYAEGDTAEGENAL